MNGFRLVTSKWAHMFRPHGFFPAKQLRRFVSFGFIALITGLLCACNSTSPARGGKKSEPTQLKVMTYNIRIGKLGGEWNNDPKKVDLGPVATLIAKHSPDVVGLQEVDRHRQRTSGMDQPASLSKKLGMNIEFQPAYSVSTSSGTNEEYGIAVMTRWPLKGSERFAMFKPDYRLTNPKYPDYYSEQRALLHSQTTIKGRTVHLFVTHLGLTEDQRDKQIRQIAEITKRFHGPKILLGDFNAEPHEKAFEALRGQFQDALAVQRASLEERKSYPAGRSSTEAIDYIFVSPEFRVLKASVIHDETLASDHNPVIAELELKP